MIVNYIWAFKGEMGQFPSGLFYDFNKAENWIINEKLTGVLTKYPIDIPVYDWAIENKLFTPKKEEHKTPYFIGKFSCASMEHEHYEKGLKRK